MFYAIGVFNEADTLEFSSILIYFRQKAQASILEVNEIKIIKNKL